MTSLRDYEDWHRHYDHPDSSLTWRLRRVQAHLRDALDRVSGPRRIVGYDGPPVELQLRRQLFTFLR